MRARRSCCCVVLLLNPYTCSQHGHVLMKGKSLLPTRPRCGCITLCSSLHRGAGTLVMFVNDVSATAAYPAVMTCTAAASVRRPALRPITQVRSKG